MKVLLVEDRLPIREALAEELIEAQHQPILCGTFAEAEDLISGIDLAIVDLKDDASDEMAGLKLIDHLRVRSFVPVIVFSAFAESVDESAFIRCVSKNANAAYPTVLAAVESFVPHVDALAQVQLEVATVLAGVLYKSADALWEAIKDPTLRPQVLLRAARRQLSVEFDHKTQGDRCLSWERYIFPAYGEHLMQADVLRKVGSEKDDASAYCLVMTATCDLSKGEGQVLVTRCEQVKAYVRAAGLADARPDRFLKKMASCLTEPRKGDYCAIPAFPGLFPDLAVALRNTEVLLQTKHAVKDRDDAKYERVVSIDAPYRELLAATFSTYTTRVGLPPCDFDRWAKDLGSD